jgi:hypothetical protein|tara:strand:+ start:6090 stop:6617 length:528 start_codon:yes stop_codon:yes gene_type:complete
MSFTRFHDDDLRIEKQLEQQTYIGRYQLNVPGQGATMPFQDEAQIRMQRWGANLQTNTINLESDLMGLTRRVGRDDIYEQDYKRNAVQSQPISYPKTNPFVEESRATHPAWMYRDLEHPIWENPIVNPQSNLEKPFHDNIQTRILEKDFYKPKISIPMQQDKTDPLSLDYYIEKN